MKLCEILTNNTKNGMCWKQFYNHCLKYAVCTFKQYLHFAFDKLIKKVCALVYYKAMSVRHFKVFHFSPYPEGEHYMMIEERDRKLSLLLD